MRGFRFSIVLFIIAVGFAFQPGPAWGTHFFKIIVVRPHIPSATDTYASWRKDEISIWCYDRKSGKTRNCRMSISLYWLETVTPPTDPAGHIKTYHVGERPLGLLEAVDPTEENENCEIVFNTLLCKSVIFNTDNNDVLVDFLLPEVSGLVMSDIYILSDDVFGIYPPRHDAHIETLYEVVWHDGFIGWNGLYYSINYKFLSSLKPVGEYYKIVRNPDSKPSHLWANAARGSTINQLKDIAKRFYRDTKYYLSVNDISLPMGGLFDLNKHWWVADTRGNGHVSHRKGGDADINRAPLVSFDKNSEVYGPTLNCEEGDELDKAVKAIASIYKSFFTKRICESGGRHHIKF